MFIVSRRTLQNFINELNPLIPDGQLKDLVKRLNRRDGPAFPACWELLLLRGLSRVGRLAYQQLTVNGKRPDICFTYTPDSDEGFIADVTAVSDDGRHRENPVDLFALELGRVARAAGVEANQLRFEIGAAHPSGQARTKVSLLLPKEETLKQFFEAKVMPFLKLISTDPFKTHEVLIEDTNVSIKLIFKPDQSFMSGQYLAYDVAKTKRTNPLWHALESKVPQLSSQGSSIPSGVVACDGGCALFRRQGRTPDAYAAPDIVHEFLSQFPQISFVWIMAIEVSNQLSRSPRFSYRPDLYYSQTFGEARAQRLWETIQRVIHQMPIPTLDPMNAHRQSREQGYGLGHQGSYEMGRHSVKISSRTLARLLAGEITAQGLWNRDDFPNPFARFVRSGRTIRAIEALRSDGEDDDWVKITFGDRDAAVAPFEISTKSEN